MNRMEDRCWLIQLKGFRACFAALVAVLLLSGCIERRFQHEHEAKVIHIFGIGWIMNSTNKTRAFGIGSLDAGHYRRTVNTNAAMLFYPPKTNDPNPLGVVPKSP